MIKGVIFDWDNTLCHTSGLGTDLMVGICKRHNLDFDKQLYVNLHGVNRTDRLKICFPDDCEWLNPILDNEYEKAYLERATLYDGVTETLQKLYKNKIKLFVFSTKNHGLIEMASDNFNIRKLFFDIVGQGNIQNKKPHKQGVEKILAESGLKRADVVLVGDSNVDQETCNNSAIAFVFATWGSKQLDVITQFDYKINRMEELLTLINV